MTNDQHYNNHESPAYKVLLQTNQGDEIGTFAVLYPEFARPDIIGWGDRVFLFGDIGNDDIAIYRETTAVYVIPPDQLPKELTND